MFDLEKEKKNPKIWQICIELTSSIYFQNSILHLFDEASQVQLTIETQ